MTPEDRETLRQTRLSDPAGQPDYKKALFFLDKSKMEAAPVQAELSLMAHAKHFAEAEPRHAPEVWPVNGGGHDAEWLAAGAALFRDLAALCDVWVRLGQGEERGAKGVKRPGAKPGKPKDPQLMVTRLVIRALATGFFAEAWTGEELRALENAEGWAAETVHKCPDRFEPLPGVEVDGERYPDVASSRCVDTWLRAQDFLHDMLHLMHTRTRTD
jgi:hypothetical protein